MNAIHTLSLKTAAAATRLAELEAKRVRAPDGRVVNVAFKELQGAIEELRVAIEQLNEMSDSLAAARIEAQRSERRYEEFFDSVPIPAVLSDDGGVIAFANQAAAQLLNLSARHLVGKPLVLFVADRDYFLQLTRDSVDTEPTTAELTIRPRDRKSRRVRAHVQHLPAHAARCWFFNLHDDEPAAS